MNQHFQNELEQLINKYSIENECDMPDYLLAQMICNFIKAVGKPIKDTLDWHGCDSVCHPKKESTDAERVALLSDPVMPCLKLNEYGDRCGKCSTCMHINIEGYKALLNLYKS